MLSDFVVLTFPAYDRRTPAFGVGQRRESGALFADRVSCMTDVKPCGHLSQGLARQQSEKLAGKLHCQLR